MVYFQLVQTGSGNTSTLKAISCFHTCGFCSFHSFQRLSKGRFETGYTILLKQWPSPPPSTYAILLYVKEGLKAARAESQSLMCSHKGFMAKYTPGLNLTLLSDHPVFHGYYIWHLIVWSQEYPKAWCWVTRFDHWIAMSVLSPLCRWYAALSVIPAWWPVCLFCDLGLPFWHIYLK